MDVAVNGQHNAIDVGTTVAALVEQYASTTRGVAVAVDGSIVPRSMWADTELKEDCRVEIITAAAGG